MITVRLPRLLDSNLREAGRLHPVDGGLNLNMVPLSTASLDVLTKDAVPGGSWIEMYSPYGTAGIYRVTSVSSGYGSEISTLELEHAISEVGDSVVNAEISQEMGLNSAISTLWGYYKGNKWKLGSNSFSDRVLVDVMYDNLLQALLGVLDQTTGYMLTFDFSTSPWTVNIVRKGTSVAAEGRLSRNVQEATVTVDRTEQCTRVYMDYDSDEGSGGTLSVDADNISQYGVIESHQTGSGYTYDQAYAVAKDYVEKHKNPAITVSITGVDFARVTGESLDVLEVGKLYRLAIPKYRVVVEENITAINWSHLYTDPTSVEVVLGPEQDKVVSYMHTTTESISRGGKGTVKKQGRYWTRFERTDHYIDQVAAYTDENGNILKQAGMYIDANGVLQYAQDNERQIGSQFKVAADRISAEVAKREEGERTLYSTIEQTATSIRTEVVNVKSGLESSITQTASQIRSEVASTKAGLESSITQTASRIDLDIKNTKEGLESQISQTDSEIRLFVGGVKGDLQSEIEVERNRIGLVVSGTGDNAKIKPASIVASINNAGSSVAIDADHVNITGTTKINDVMTVVDGGLVVSRAALFRTGTHTVSINNGKLTAEVVQAGDLKFAGSGEGQYRELDYAKMGNVVVDASVSGNTLTLTKGDGTTLNFSKATTLRGEWGSDKFTVTASPQNVPYDVKVTIDQNFTPSGQSSAIKIIKPSATGANWLRVQQQVGDLSSGERTIKTIVGSTTVEETTITDYNDGFNAVSKPSVTYTDLGDTTIGNVYGHASISDKTDGTTRSTSINLSLSKTTYTPNPSVGAKNCVVVKTSGGTVVGRIDLDAGYDAGYVAGWNAARSKVTRDGDTIYRPKARTATDGSTARQTENEEAFIANYTASSHSNNRKASAEGYYKIGTTGSSVDLEGSESTNAYAMTLIPKANVTAGVYVYIKPSVSGGDSYTASSFDWTDK